MIRSPFSFIFLFTLVFCFSIASVTAISVTITPTQIQEGGTVTIEITDLADGKEFSLLMEADIIAQAGSDFTFQTNQVTVPFGLNDAVIELTANNVAKAGVEASGGSTTFYQQKTTSTGTVSIKETRNSLPAGTITILKAFGTVKDGKTSINLVLGISGKKTGANSGSVTFTLSGISDGSTYITILVDGIQVIKKQIVIQPPQTQSPSSGGSPAGAAVSSPGTFGAPGGIAPLSPAWPNPDEDVSPPAPPAPAPSPEPPAVVRGGVAPLSTDLTTGQTQRSEIVVSPMEVAQLFVNQGTIATIEVVDPVTQEITTVPVTEVTINEVPVEDAASFVGGATFSFAGEAVRCGPAGATFSEAVGVTFGPYTQEKWDALIAEAGNDPSSFAVERFNTETNSWERVYAEVNPVTRTITAETTHFSLFALFIAPGAATPIVTEVVVPLDIDGQVLTAGGVMPEATLPPATIAPVTTETAEPSAFPWTYAIIGIVIILLIAGGAYYYTRK